MTKHNGYLNVMANPFGFDSNGVDFACSMISPDGAAKEIAKFLGYVYNRKMTVVEVGTKTGGGLCVTLRHGKMEWKVEWYR